MPVTIYDVARRAGVGIGTVSRVLNNSPQISPKTREKVLKVIKDLKYQPHAMAQGLARKRTNSLACIVPSFTGYFYLELINGIQQALNRHGFDLILYSVVQMEKETDVLKRTLRERKVDGVLLVSMPISEDYVKKFTQSKFPIVLVDSFHERVDSIAIENREGAFIATRHLIDLGHTRIGMINGNLNSVPAKIRLDGFKSALAENNIPFVHERVITVLQTDNKELNHNHGFNKVAGYEAMLQLLNLKENRPTAVFISSDIQAAGAVKAVRERGLQIPDDIAIVGFDGIELSEYLGLTTMKQPMFEMGMLAVDRLIEKIQNPESSEKIIKKLFHTQLIIRDTCGSVSTRKESSKGKKGEEPLPAPVFHS
ncbi:MAG: LacI family DNA-binding transcriptional regulator [Candidatus Zhuqueibacterota bacterium]